MYYLATVSEVNIERQVRAYNIHTLICILNGINMFKIACITAHVHTIIFMYVCMFDVQTYTYIINITLMDCWGNKGKYLT